MLHTGLGPALHALPQAPQLSVSVAAFTFTHAPEQQVPPATPVHEMLLSSVNTDVLVEGWQVWHGFAGFTALVA
jgi:hypothetical protein